MKLKMERYQLKNGVRVILVPREGTESVMAMVWVRTGSRNEAGEKLGMSHVLEHMVFKGTPTWPRAKDLASELDSLGAEFNAFTDKEMTAFYVNADGGYLSKSLAILGEMVSQPKLREEDWQREKGVIIEEINMYEDQPMEKAVEEFENVIFRGSNLGRPIIGYKETVAGLTTVDLRAYQEEWYRGENVLVTVVGRVEKGVRKMIEESFGVLPEGTMKAFVDEGRYGQEREKVIEKKTEQTHFVVGVPSLSLQDEGRYVEAVVAVALGGNMSSRLFTEVREKRGLAYYVRAYSQRYWDRGYLGVRAGVKKEKFEEAVAVVKKEMAELGESLEAEEVARAKEYLIGKMSLSLESNQGVARWIGGREVLGLRSEEVEEVRRRIGEVTVEEARAMAKRLFKEEEMRLVVVR